MIDYSVLLLYTMRGQLKRPSQAPWPEAPLQVGVITQSLKEHAMPHPTYALVVVAVLIVVGLFGYVAASASPSEQDRSHAS